ncbi:serine hydrolase FSH [Rhexocercosporidium sp. MPI-PUGE-AT-0058]|nr:serine hydrolase FSH [Rhexocercosporidium sp. MPI-PUGE-AT-0058]
MPSADSTSSRLPRILCLHGGGTTGAIFEIQSHKLRFALRRHFQFTFIDSPFEGGPGPGVLPVFDGAGPFRRWHCESPENSTLRSIIAERDIVRDFIEGILLGAAEGGAPFVGVMAFSQGTRIATGLMVEQMRSDYRSDIPLLKFAVLLCGNYPYLPFRGVRVTAPSVHSHGMQDPWLDEGRKLLATCYEASLATLLEFQGGHRLPQSRRDVDLLAKAVVNAYKKGSAAECGG